MKILFLHGLESKLNNEKRMVLEKFGVVNAADLDYKSDPHIFTALQKLIEDWQPDALIGSSMGGFMGFFLAQITGIPALLYNPALLSGRRYQVVPDNLPKGFNSSVQLILGEVDDVVLPAATLDFLKTHYPNDRNIFIKTIPQLAHQIPLDVFTKETTAFFKHYF